MGKTEKSKSAPVTSASAHVAKKRAPKRSIDGVKSTRKASTTKKPVAKKQVVAATPTPQPISKPTMMDVHQPAHHRRQQQPSSTLMRRVVHKPVATPSPRNTHRAQGPIQGSHASAVVTTGITPKLSVGAVDITRLNHAKHVPKSDLVTRFNAQPAAFIASEPLQITPQPANKSVASTPSVKPAHHSDMFVAALNSATSHQQPAHPAPHYRKKRYGKIGKIAGISTAVLSIALVVGVLVYQNMGSIKLQLASSQAGFNATMPTHKPSGYSLENFSAASGIVAAHFKSNSDTTRGFTITEKESNWDSASLRDNYVHNAATNYQVVESGGRTIYLFNGNSATWVSGGIWYLVTNADNLSNNDLIALATSM